MTHQNGLIRIATRVTIVGTAIATLGGLYFGATAFQTQQVAAVVLEKADMKYATKDMVAFQYKILNDKIDMLIRLMKK